MIGKIALLLACAAMVPQPPKDDTQKEKDAAQKSADLRQEPAKRIRLRKKNSPPALPSKPSSKPGQDKVNEERAPAVPKRTIPMPKDDRKATDLDRLLIDDLGKDLDGAQAQQDPLMRVGQRMRTVEERLARREGTDETVELQRAILSDLEELLKQAQQRNNSPQKQKNSQKRKQQQQKQQMQQQSSGKTQGKQSKRSASAASQGNAGQLETGNANVIKDVWGHLSATEREQMIQYAKESFLPAYRELLERYYTSIAKRSRSDNE